MEVFFFPSLMCNQTGYSLLFWAQEPPKKGSPTESDEAGLKEYTEHQSLEKGILKETGLFLWYVRRTNLQNQIPPAKVYLKNHAHVCTVRVFASCCLSF